MDEDGQNQTTDNGVVTNEDDEAPEETEFRKKAKRRSNAIVLGLYQTHEGFSYHGTLQIQG